MLKYELRNCICRKSEGPSDFDLEALRLAIERRGRSDTIEANSMKEQQRRAKDALQAAADALGLFGPQALLEVADLPAA